MVVVTGPIKIDLFLGDPRHEVEEPWTALPATLDAIDSHFWDWALWLGGKVLGGHDELVIRELAEDASPSARPGRSRRARGNPRGRCG